MSDLTPIHRGLVLCQWCDITALQARVPSATKKAVKSASACLDAVAEQTGGHRVRSEAVGVMYQFDSVSDAARFAALGQERLLDVDWPEKLLVHEQAEVVSVDEQVIHRGLRVRMGLHRGLVGRLEGENLSGPGVHQVAKLCHAAQPGQVLMSESARRSLRATPGVSLILRDLGSQRFAGVSGEQRLFQVSTERVEGRDFTEPDTLMTRRSNVGDPGTTFLGRSGELGALAELVGFGVRWITVTGGAGVGKSRLVRRFSALQRPVWADAGGVWYVDLVGCVAAEDVLWRLGGVVDLLPRVGRSVDEALEGVIHGLGERGRVLLCLDGLEVLDTDCLRVLERLHQHCGEVVMVVTCDSPVGVVGEVCFELEALAMPKTPSDRHADSVRLFEARAKAVNPAFKASAIAISDVVIRLQGNPVAVGLAGAMAGDKGIDATIEAVTHTRRPLSMLKRAWHALNRLDQRVLARSAVFAGPFTKDAIRGLLDGEDVAALDPLVHRLVELGWWEPALPLQAPGVRRLQVPYRLRLFMREQLRPEIRDDAFSRMASRAVELCESWLPHALGRDAVEVVARIVDEEAHLLGFVDEFLQSEHEVSGEGLSLVLRAILAIEPLFDERAPLRARRQVLDAVLEKVDTGLDVDPVYQSRALALRGRLRLRRGRFERAEADLVRARDIGVRWNDQGLVGRCLIGLAEVELSRGQSEQAAELLTKAGDALEASSDWYHGARAAGLLALIHLDQGKLDQAQAGLSSTVSTLREREVWHELGVQLGNLGVVYRRMGQPGTTRSLYREAVHILLSSGDVRLASKMIANTGVLEYQLNRIAEAIKHYNRALRMARDAGDLGQEAQILDYLGVALLESGDHDGAQDALVRALASARSSGDLAVESSAIGYLGILHHFTDRPDTARGYYQDAMAALEEGGDHYYQALFMAWLATLEAEQGDVDKARVLFDLAEMRLGVGPDGPLGEAVRMLRLVEALQRAEGSEAVEIRSRIRAVVSEVASRPSPGATLRFAVMRLVRLKL